MTFDPYHKWLGIPPAEQPPHHYRLLGVALFESDQDVLESAADRQMGHVRTFQAGQHSALSQQILNELAAAKLCLLDPQKKSVYDAGLRMPNQLSQVAAQTKPTSPVALVADRLREADAQPHFDRTFGDRQAADGLETTVDQPQSGQRAQARKQRAALSQPELAEHPDYEIVSELGRGGMGTVYLAKNRLMDRLEVLKVLNKSFLQRPGALERFQQEIRSAAKLGHVNIVAAHSVIRLGDSLVFAMEYVPGENLAQLVQRRGPLRVPNAAYYAHQAALGLQHAHEKGMVHRDIKPNNLMLATEGKKHIVKILDFGLAKATSEKDAETGLTKSGQILGTPDYLAPEQIRNAQRADIRADIYSLGCTLYFLLSGKRPFPESSLYDVLDAHQNREAKPLDDVRPDVPHELAAVVAKMMAKSPADRYQTPVQVARALIPFFKPGQVAVPADGLTGKRDVAQPAEPTEREMQPFAASPTGWPTPEMAVPVAAPRAVPIAIPLSKITFESSIDFETPLADSDHDLRPPPRSWRLYLATCLAAVVLMLGIAILVHTPHGTIEIQLSEPDAERVALVTDQTENDGALDNGVAAQAPVSTSAAQQIGTEMSGPTETRTAGKSPAQAADLPDAVTPKLNTAPAVPVAPFDEAQARAHQEAWAKFLNVPVEQTNSIGMKLVLIPPGEFTMGSTPEQVAVAKRFAQNPGLKLDSWTIGQLKAETPAHRVTISHPYLLGATETTVAQYRRFFEATRYVTETERFGGGDSSSKTEPNPNKRKRSWQSPGAALTDDSAVSQITWSDAAAFCNWLSGLERKTACYHRGNNDDWTLLLDADGYRLPTEAEWEYACRAGTSTQYSFADDPADLQQFGGAVSDMRAVAVKKPNPFGLYDMHGNLEEWCHDWIDYQYYARSPSIDPTGPATAYARILRGGTWDKTRQAPLWRRSAFRRSYTPIYRSLDAGFRVVRVSTNEYRPSTNDSLKSGTTLTENRRGDQPATVESVLPRGSKSAPAVNALGENKARGAIDAPSIPIAGLDDPAFQQWLKEVEGLPAEKLATAVVEKLREFNRGLPAKGRVTYEIAGDAVTEIAISSPIVNNLLPLRALRGLESFTYVATGARGERGILTDLSPLAGMQITRLVCRHSKVSDLSALRGMPLQYLDCSDLEISDLLPLAGMPLKDLHCSHTNVVDLSALKGMLLTDLDVSYTLVTDLSPLKGMPLTSLNCAGTGVSDLSPLRGSPLKKFDCSNTKVTDHSPLLDIPALIAAPLIGREARNKLVLVGKHGGTAKSESAVASGLSWLARNQRKDGTWSLKGPYRSGSTVGRDVPESATAMAVMAFLGAGNTPDRGEFNKQVANGMKALLRLQGSDGNFFQEGGTGNNWFYGHAQCTIAVCELYGMTKDAALKKPAELAVKYCIDSQDPVLGGWKYLPRSKSDTSVTGWMLMALQTARVAGLEVPDAVFERVSEYLDKVTPDGSRYSYESGSEPTLSMTATALLCRQSLGWKRDDPRLIQGVELLMQNLPRYEDRDVYYWHHGTRVMHNMQGKYWKAWNGALRDMLVKNQEKTGLEKGSWDPLGEHPDRWSNQGQGMRLYTTCLSLYMLEAYYRHLPIYEIKK